MLMRNSHVEQWEDSTVITARNATGGWKLRTRAGMLALLVATTMVIGSTTVAAATSAQDITYANASTGFCLDGSVIGTVYASDCNTGNQRWTVISRGGEVRSLKNASTLYCLDSNSDRKVYARECNEGGYQNWSVDRNSAGSRLKNFSTGFCLDSDKDRKVYTEPCNDGNFQRWK